MNSSSSNNSAKMRRHNTHQNNVWDWLLITHSRNVNKTYTVHTKCMYRKLLRIVHNNNNHNHKLNGRRSEYKRMNVIQKNKRTLQRLGAKEEPRWLNEKCSSSFFFSTSHSFVHHLFSSSSFLVVLSLSAIFMRWIKLRKRYELMCVWVCYWFVRLFLFHWLFGVVNVSFSELNTKLQYYMKANNQSYFVCCAFNRYVTVLRCAALYSSILFTFVVYYYKNIIIFVSSAALHFIIFLIFCLRIAFNCFSILNAVAYFTYNSINEVRLRSLAQILFKQKNHGERERKTTTEHVVPLKKSD